MADTPSTPPRRSKRGTLPPNPMTPEQVRRMEEARLRAKALAKASATTQPVPAPAPIAGTKRTYSSINPDSVPKSHRDASNISPSNPRLSKPTTSTMTQPHDPNLLRPAKNFARSSYIEYDFSKMTDTKGGFLSTEDDPFNRAMKSSVRKDDQKPENMTLAEWERERLRRKLVENRSGRYEPGISVLDKLLDGDEEDRAIEEAEKEGESEEYKGKYGDGKRDVKGKCRECGTLEIDWKWQDVFSIGVCGNCRDKYPDKYSLLTKTEAREDYLLTDPELRDEELLPHLERPNPHKQNFHNMQLFLRLQVEAYAFSPRKWGSQEALDAEYEKRQVIAKERKEKKFKNKLQDLKKRTRVEAYKRARLMGDEAGEVKFGARIKGLGDKHEHEWGIGVMNPETGMTKKRCEECGMEVEELEF